MKKTMKIVALLAIAGTTATTLAAPRESVTAASVPSFGLTGNASNTILTLNATGSDAGGSYTVQSIRFSGSLGAFAAGSFQREAHIRVTPPSGTPFNIAPFTVAAGTAGTATDFITIPVSAVTTAGTWTFEFFDGFDDNTTLADATWTDVTIALDDAAPAGPTPGSGPSVTFSNVDSDGLLTATSTPLTWNNTTPFASPARGVRIRGRVVNLNGGAANENLNAPGNVRVSVQTPGAATPTTAWTTDLALTSMGTVDQRVGIPASASVVGDWNFRFGEGADSTLGIDNRWLDVSFELVDVSPPATSISLTANTPVSDTVVVTAPQTVRWYTITVPEISAAANRGLRIDNEGSATTPLNDTAMALYNSDGSIRLTDTLDGTDLLASMSFGVDNGAAPGNGLAYNGRDGTLAAGTYFLAVVAGATPVWGSTFNVTGVSATATATALTTNFLLRDPVVSAPPSTPITLTEGAFASATSSIATAGGVAWFRFTTPAGLVSTGGLDVDLEGTSLSPVNDTELYLFGPGGGGLISSDTDSGTDLLSQLSYGAAGSRRNAPGNGLAFRAQNGTVGTGNTILPGTQYFLAVAGGNASTGAGGYAVTGGDNTGPVTARVRVYSSNALSEFAPPPSTIEQNFGTLGNAVVDNTSTFAAASVKWFQFTTPAEASVASGNYVDIWTLADAFLGTNTFQNDTQIGLYPATGTLLTSDDQSGGNNLSALTFGATTPARTTGDANTALLNGNDGALSAGTYYLAVGGWIMTFGADFVVTSTGDDAGPVTVKIGSNFAPTCVCCNLSNVAGPNQSTTPDNELTADDIIVFLGWYFAGDNRANVAGPNQSTTPDNELTADDIIVFLGRYFAGC